MAFTQELAAAASVCAFSPLFLRGLNGNKTLSGSQTRCTASRPGEPACLQAGQPPPPSTTQHHPPWAQGVHTVDRGPALGGGAGRTQVTSSQQFVRFEQKSPATFLNANDTERQQRQTVAEEIKAKKRHQSCTYKPRRGGDGMVGCSAAGLPRLCKVCYEIFHSVHSQARGSCLQKGRPK